MRISDADKALFRTSVAGARRLRSAKAPPRAAPPPPTAAMTRADREAVLRELAETPAMPDHDDDAFRRPGVSPQICRDLRAGRYVIHSALDLHGVRSFELADRLKTFLREARRNGQRCVRIVHGKGRNSPGREPVLKHQARELLRRRAEVLAYCTAPAHDGGSGALYVLLSK